MEEEQGLRFVPQNEMDLHMQLTDPKWGQDVPKGLRDKLSKIIAFIDENEEQIQTQNEQLWEQLSFFTRDVRLGNLSVIRGEEQYCRYYLDLAGDFLRQNYINSFLIALSRAISVLELSQSKGGFLRKRQGTVTQEHFKEEREPKKTPLFGKARNEQQ